MRKKYLLPLFALFLLGAASCERGSEDYAAALKNFDDYEGIACPREPRLAIARELGARKDETRVIHYGPTGKPDHSNYFAALSREGKVVAGIYDEAPGKILEIHHENEFKPEDFAWVVKCLRNDPPFGDRQVRYGAALVVDLAYGTQDIKLSFIDGWLPEPQKWSTGSVKINVAGTALLDEEHGLEFAFPPGESGGP